MIALFAKIASQLEAQELTYMLSGSLAMGYYTTARMTRDIDVVIHLQHHQVDNFVALFEGSYIHKPTVMDEIDRRGMFNVIEQTTGIKIDFIVMKNDTYSQLAMDRRKSFVEADSVVWVISIEDLVIAKLRWIQVLFSERQAQDIESLLRNPKLDHDYLREWVDRLKLTTFDLLQPPPLPCPDLSTIRPST
jgi:hypothetical protein